MVLHKLRSHVLALCGIAVLASCGNVGMFYREGADQSAVTRKQISCETAALKQAPIAQELRQRAPTYIPGDRYCRAGGCYGRPGYWVDGGFYTVDANQSLRNSIITQCMADAGYGLIELPKCQGDKGASITRRQPALSDNSCAVQTADGQYHIVNP